jgi:hypothetical protein
MTTNLIPKSDVLFTESPVSWNTRYTTPEGFECQFTLRGESGQEVLEKASAAINYFLSNGCSPVATHFPNNGKASAGNPENGNGNHHPTPSNGDNQSSWCPIHNIEMRRWEKNGRVWFSHRMGDEWCSGRLKRK